MHADEGFEEMGYASFAYRLLYAGSFDFCSLMFWILGEGGFDFEEEEYADFCGLLIWKWIWFLNCEDFFD